MASNNKKLNLAKHIPTTAGDIVSNVMIFAYIAIIVSYYKTLKVPELLISGGVGCLLYSLEVSVAMSVGAAILVLFLMMYYNKREGFNTHTPATEISNTLRKLKQHTIEGYEDVKKEKDENPAPAEEEGFKKAKEMPTAFKLGEIPSQAKNGPHIDAASTLVKAINSLDPEQIKAMSKDTQQLIDTQKSLMGMLGNMKPMLNDGKELMDTFQQMFGK